MDQPLSLDTTVAISEDSVFRDLDGEAVLLNLESGMYFGLDAVGTRIWQLAAEAGSLRTVRERLLGEFDTDAGTVERDLLALAAALLDKGLWVIPPAARKPGGP
jgi:hypothetical protein